MNYEPDLITFAMLDTKIRYPATDNSHTNETQAVLMIHADL